MGTLKTQMGKPLSSRNRSSKLEGREVSSSGLKKYRLINQVVVMIALARSFGRVEDCEQGEIFGWYKLTSNLDSEGEVLRISGVCC